MPSQDSNLSLTPSCNLFYRRKYSITKIIPPGTMVIFLAILLHCLPGRGDNQRIVGWDIPKKPVVAVSDFIDVQTPENEGEKLSLVVKVLFTSALHRSVNLQVAADGATTPPPHLKLSGTIFRLNKQTDLDLQVYDLGSKKVIFTLNTSFDSPTKMRPALFNLAAEMEHRYLRPNLGGLVLESNPSTAQVYMQERYMGTTSANIPMLLKNILAGDYKIAILKGGYEPFITRVRVKPDVTSKLKAQLIPLPGSVLITSNPPAAKIYLDNELKGVTPLQIEGVSVGKHTVTLKLDNYSPWKQEIQVQSSISAGVNARMIKMPGQLTITSKPSGAMVKLGGKKIGETPLNLDTIEAGKYLIEVEKKEFLSDASSVTIAPSEKKQLHYDLQSIYGQLYFVSTNPQKVSVVYKGETLGVTPLKGNKILPGNHLFEFHREGFYSLSKVIKVKSGEIIQDEVSLKPMIGLLNITSTPAGAKATLTHSDKGTMVELGQTPIFNYRYPVGEYQLSLEKKGYYSQKASIHIKDDKPITINLSIEQIPGTFILRSPGYESQVYINGYYVGNTPCQVDQLARGDYQVELKNPFDIYRTKKTLEPNKVEKVEADLRKDRPYLKKILFLLGILAAAGGLQAL